MRIVSLLPSATEIVASLGLTDSLVGISADCDYPPAIRGLPVLSEAIVSSDLASPVIDRRIRDRRHTGQSVYHLDPGQLAALRPDVILTQELCTVCAPSFTLVLEAARLLDGETRIVSLEPHGLLDIVETIRVVGAVTGAPGQAVDLAGRLERRIDAVTALVERFTVGHRADPIPSSQPRVVCVEWLDPIWIGGWWVPEMVARAGGSDVLGAPRRPSREAAWDEVLAADPDVLVVMACGFDLERTRAEIGLLSARPGWDTLRAVRTGRVYLTNGSAYFNRPGPRIIDGLEMLATMIHPESSPLALVPGAAERL